MTDFDRYIERRGTMSLKYDFMKERGKPEGALPLWVADMDFEGPDCVRDALHYAVKDGIFGYSEAKEDYFNAVAGWFDRHYGWKPSSEWLVKTPGVVFAIAAAIRALTKEGDAVIIQTPVYYPFFEAIRDNGRKVVRNRLVLENGRYSIDFEDFENRIVKENVKLFVLCSPHNPVGRVWTPEELQKLWEICKKHGVFVVSDEIHGDMIRDGFVFTTFLKANPDAKEQSVICTAPSKTFNLAGLQVSNIFIPSDNIRKLVKKEIDKTGYSQLNLAGLVACKAAYEGGEEWHRECLAYLEGNLSLIRDFLKERLPEIHLIEPEGTYFAWIDFRSLSLSDIELDSLILERAGLWLDAGHIFGAGGSGFQRIAYACRREMLKEALERLEKAIKR